MTERAREPDVRFRFGHDVQASRQARERLNPLLCQPDDMIADDVLLAASEMVTNVIAHTDGGGEMRAWDPRPDVPLRIEVEDDDQAPPLIPARARLVGGRGIAIVAAVSDQWGYELHSGGKVIWAEFDRNKRRRTQPDAQNHESHIEDGSTQT